MTTLKNNERNADLPSVEEHCNLVSEVYVKPVLNYLSGGEKLTVQSGQYIKLYTPV